MATTRLARILVVAGSDSGGGAGIQADIKAVTALGGYAASAVTALTAQNTLGVHGVVQVAPSFVAEQMEAVLDDLGADCLKTGMLPTAEAIDAVCAVIDAKAADIPLVVDPVMVAKGGAALLDRGAVAALVEKLVPRARIVTPNAPEATALVGGDIASTDDLAAAAERLIERGARGRAGQGRPSGRRCRDRRARRRRERHARVRIAAHRFPTYPRNRLHASLGRRHGHRPGHGPGRCGRARAALCASRDRAGARTRRRSRPAQPHGRRSRMRGLGR